MGEINKMDLEKEIKCFVDQLENSLNESAKEIKTNKIVSDLKKGDK